MRQITNIMFIFLLLSGADASVREKSKPANEPVLRVVFFTPSDVEPPEGVRLRLKEYVDYSQVFFKKWMKHWGYESKNPLPVERDKDGYPKILYVRGKYNESSGRYKRLGFQPEVVEGASKKYKIDPKGQVWWIFIYRGPERRGFRGGGNARRGGTSTSIYDPSDKGHLRLEDELGSDEQARIKSKGSIHELGHALGLPHIGPRDGDKFGNSLMGPIIRAYRRRNPDEKRVYLSEAAAAMLWKHPLFRGSTKDRAITPRFEIKDFRLKYDRESGKLIASGKTVSSYPMHTIVLRNESEATRSAYWTKYFTGRVTADGGFKVEIGELEKTNGLLRIVGCFNNGMIVGESKGFGMRRGFVKRYSFAERRFSLVKDGE